MKITVSLLLMILLASNARAQTPSSSDETPSDETLKPVAYNWSHTGEILAVSFSPDGQTALSVDAKGLINFWNTQTGRKVRSIDQGAPVVAATFYEHEKIALAMGRKETEIVVRNIMTGEEIETLAGHTRTVTALAFSPHGDTIVSGGNDQYLMLWGVAGELTHLFRGHEDAIRAVAFSPNGEQIVSASADRTVRLWDLQTPDKAVLSFRPYKSEVSSIAFAPDGQALLSIGFDTVKRAAVYSVKVWRLSKKKQTWKIEKKPIVFAQGADPIATAVFSPDGKRIMVGTSNGKIAVWEIATQKKIQTFEENKGEVKTSALSRDGRFALTAGGGKLNLWKMADTAGDLRGKE